MKIAVIGGGFTGLACAVTLTKRGHTPVVFESGDRCGGLAAGFNPGNWRWNLECFYHHVFTNDRDILKLAEEVGCKVLIQSPLTTSFVHQKEEVLDSPLSLLKFSGLSVWGRIRMGVGLLALKMIPYGLFLEKHRAAKVLPGLLGEAGYKLVWERLLTAKFGPCAGEVNMAWFWSRVAKRTKKLGYFEGGFNGLIEKTVEYVRRKRGEVRLKSPVRSVKTDRDGMLVNGERFEAVVVTTPAPIAEKLLPGLSFPRINYLWGQTLVMEVERKLIKGYWMNVLEKDFPFLVMVDHTNMVDKQNYGNKRVVYLGNYLVDGHRQLKMTKEELIRLYMPFIRKINKRFDKRQIKETFLFREPYAQPVFPVNYSKQLPKMRWKARVYIANMSMVYPFDRGTNYAVKMGVEVAKKLLDDLRWKDDNG